MKKDWDIPLGIFAIALLGFCKFGGVSPPEPIATLDKRAERNAPKQVTAQIGGAAAIKKPPRRPFALNTLTGFYTGRKGAKIYLDLPRGFWLNVSRNQIFNCRVKAIGDDKVVMTYGDNYGDDVIQVVGKNGISIGPVDQHDRKSFFKRIEP